MGGGKKMNKYRISDARISIFNSNHLQSGVRVLKSALAETASEVKNKGGLRIPNLPPEGNRKLEIREHLT